MLAAGTRRGFVLVDQSGNVHSLSRYVAGHNAKAIAARLAPLVPASLPSVDDAKEIVRQRRQAQEECARERQRQEPPASGKARAELAARHAARRAKHIAREQQLLTRQQHERLSLDAAQQSERQGIVFRARSAVADFIRGTPGLRSVLGPIQKLTGIDPRQRQRLESDALTRRHKRERADVERRKRALSKIEARESQSLLKMLRRRQEESLRAVWDAHAHEVSDHTARHGAGDGGGAEAIRGGRQFDDGDLREEFSASAGHDHHPGDDGGGGDDDRARRWNSRAKTRTPGRRRRRGKGYGYRPGED